MKWQRIYVQHNGKLNEDDRLAIAQLLVKAGYTVRHGREKVPGKGKATYVYFVEFAENTGE